MGRLRTIANADTIVADSKYCINDKTKVKFTGKEIELEIGSGKGDFLLQNALLSKDKVYIGYEKYATVIIKAIRKMELNQIDNVWFVNDDATNLLDYFDESSISKIYLNFSDPWPKKRHIKNRLVNPRFLALYKKILKNHASIEFKTDNDNLFEYALSVLNSDKKIKIEYCSFDLYKDIEENVCQSLNVASEYEKKFRETKNINKVIWHFL